MDRRLSLVGAASAILIAGICMTGWLLDIEILKTVGPSGAEVKPNTALALAASGTALALATFMPRVQSAPAALGCATSAFAFVFLLEYALGVDFGVDNLLFHDASTYFPGRPSMPTSACIVALGLAVALFNVRSAALDMVRVALAVLIIVLALTGIIGHLVSPVDPLLRQTLFGIRFPVAIALSLLGLGVLAPGRFSKNLTELVRVRVSILAVAAMAALVVVNVFAINPQRDFRDQVRAEAILESLARLLDLLRDAETGQLSYLLTGSEDYLKLYSSATPLVASQSNQLATLVGNDATTRDRLDRIRSLTDRELSELRRAIDLKRAGDKAGAMMIVDAADGKRMMNQLRQDIGAMQAASQRDADTLRASADRALTWLQFAAMFAVSLVIGLVAFLLLDGRRRLSQARLAQERLIAANENLDQIVAQRTKELSSALEAASTSLRESKKTEAALRESEHRLRRFYDSGLVGVIYWKLNGQITEANDKFLEMLGYTREDLKSDRIAWTKITPPELLPRTEASLVELRARGNERPWEKEYLRKDGTRLPVLCANAMLDHVHESGVAFVLDITERKQAELALRESEQKLRRFYDAGLLGVIYWNMDGEITDANDKFLQMVGYTREEMQAGSIDWQNMTPPEFRHLDEASVRELQATGANAAPFEKEYVRKDGSRIPILLASATIDEARQNGVAFVLDITERKRAEETARRQAEMLRQSFDAIIVWPWGGGIETWNRGAEELYGISEAEAVGNVTHDLLQTAFPVPLTEIETQLQETGGWEGELRHRAVDGGERVVSARLQLIVGVDGVTHVLQINRDITERKKAEDRLRESEALLAAVLNQMPIAVGVTDKQGKFILKNARVDRFTGTGEYPASYARDFTRWKVWDASGAALPQSEFPVVRVLSGRSEISMEALFRDDDGREIWTQAAAAPLLDDSGAVIGAIATIVDIDERKRAEEAVRESERRLRIAGEALRLSEAKLRHAADAAALTYATLDVATGQTSVADNFERVMGFAARPLQAGRPLAETISSLVRSGDRSASLEAHDAVQTLLTGVPEVRLERKVRGEDGVDRWIQSVWSLEEGADERSARIFVTNQDVTALVRSREALAEAKSEAERASLSKSKFMASASHDLRQPVQSLVFLLALVEKQVKGNPKASHSVGLMRHAIGGLNGLLTAILDISRLEAGAIEPNIEVVDLGSLIDRLANEYAPKAAMQRLDLRVVTRDLCVSTDATLVERVLRNLIENALRYTPKGGVLVGMRRRGDTVRVEVIDTGIGIPGGKQTEIFEEFRQLGNPGRNLEMGLGLGLAIVGRIAALLGTRVEVSSKPGRGSRFSLTLPLSAGWEGAATKGQEKRRESRGMVLVIEDNDVLRHSLQETVGDWGFEVLTAATGEDALDLSSPNLPLDAIITDYRLGPGLNGVEAALEIRRKTGSALPTLVLTGDTAKDSLLEIRASGFQCLHKPIDPDVLRGRVADMLSCD